MKKQFKDTKGFKIIKSVGNVALDILPIPDIRKYFDRDNDGKVSYKDFKWFEFLIGIGILGVLINYDIVQPEQIIALIQAILG
jgi:hypothetical protein